MSNLPKYYFQDIPTEVMAEIVSGMERALPEPAGGGIRLHPPLTRKRAAESFGPLSFLFARWRSERSLPWHRAICEQLPHPPQKRRMVVDIHKKKSVATPCGEGSFQPLTERKERTMFTRVVEINAKSGKVSELANTITDKVVPILKKQAGFVDEAVLTSDTEPNRIIGLSFWNSKEDAMRYHQEAYPKVNEILSPLLEGAPVVRTFNVHTSTTHKITAGKAA